MMSPFEWYYQVGNISQEDGKRVLKNPKLVGFPEEAERLVKEGEYGSARRFRCDKKLGMIDEEWYDPKTDAWI